MNQSVRKALSLLNLFTEETPELTLGEIANRSGMPKSTAYRLLTTLESCDFLSKTKENEHDSRYRLGLKLLDLGQIVLGQLELREIALPLMEQLAQEINEVVHLVIVHQNKATYIEKVDSTRALRLHTRVGKSLPLYLGSGPKLLLASLAKEKQDRALHALDDSRRKQLLEELATIRNMGYAYSIGEQDVDTTGISYPVYNHQNKVTAALAVSGLSSYFKGENLATIKEKTSATARKISQRLGYRNTWPA